MDLVGEIKIFVSKLQVQIKEDNSNRTIRKFKGGRVIVPPDDVYNCPEQIPLDLWLTLKSMHNNSQLWAIKYVASSNHRKPNGTLADTQISLVQGPPGTGKTFTILGIHLYDFTNKRIKSCILISTLLSGMLSAMLHDTANKTKRVLLCAPSNAAVDELLSRIMDSGIIGEDGCRRMANVVRLGKLPTDTPPDVASKINHMILDEKVEEVIKQSGLMEEKKTIKQEIEELLNKIDAVKTKGGDCHGHDYKKSTLTRYYTSLNGLYARRHQVEDKIDKTRIQAAQEIIQQAEIVISTLSSSGILFVVYTYT